MGLELVETLLSQHKKLFHADPMFKSLVTRQVSVLVKQVEG
jgi:hypothetical protein